MASPGFGDAWALGLRDSVAADAGTISHAQAVSAQNEAFAFWERELSAKRVDLVVAGEDCPIHVPLVAASHGAAYRALTPARLGSRCYWGEDPHHRTPALRRAYERLTHMPPDTAEAAVLDEAAGAQPSPGAGGVRAWLEYRKLRRLGRARLSDLAGAPFAFFPLQPEPDPAVGRCFPECFGQLEALTRVARHLPAGVRLVVQEHPAAIGRRPSHFYRQIHDIKCAILLDPHESRRRAVEQAAVVAARTDACGIEAAVLGVPVVTFGRRNLFDFLPHVFVVRDVPALREMLAGILAGAVDRERARQDGDRFRRALRDVSFEPADTAEMAGTLLASLAQAGRDRGRLPAA
jgi:hypothetical protein